MKNPKIILFSILLCAGLPNLSRAESLPEMRPALLSRGHRSLINLIDGQSLMKRGQGDGVVMFSCGVDTLGNAGGGISYRGTPHSELLGREVVERIDHAQFEPAVFHHNHVPVWIGGTVAFFIKDGKPHVRVYLNQQDKDLAEAHDFIAPQFAFIPDNNKFRGFYSPRNAPGHDLFAVVTLDVMTDGKVAGSKVFYEYPPGLGFGSEVAGRVRDALFIPGFRDGKCVRSQFNWALSYDFLGHQMKTG